MKQKHTEMPVRFLPVQTAAETALPVSKGEAAASVLLHAAVFGFAFYGCLFLFLDIFTLPVYTVWVVAVTSFLWIVLVLHFAFTKGKKRLWILLPILIVVVCAFIWRGALTQGLLRYYNQLASMLNITTYWTFPSVSLKLADEADILWQSTLAVCFLLFWLALLTGYAVMRRSSVLLLVLVTATFLWAPIGFRIPVLLPAFFAVLTAYFTLYIYRFGVQKQKLGPPPEKKKRRGSHFRYAPKMQTFAAIPLVLLTAVWAVFLLPEQGYKRPKSASELRESIVNFDWREVDWNTAFGIRFQGFGDGDLRNLGALNYSGRTVIKVKSTKYETCYLRDFTGAILEERKWQPVSEKDYGTASAEFSDLVPQRLSSMLFEFEEMSGPIYYWNGSGFSTLNQLYYVQVRNIAAPRGAVFLPSFLKSFEEEIENVSFSGEAQASLQSGTDYYSFEVFSPEFDSLFSGMFTGREIGSAADYYENLTEVGLDFVNAPPEAVNTAGLSFAEFCDQVESYNRYVYDTYTALPDDVRAAAEALREKYQLQPVMDEWSMDIEQTISQVRSLLHSQCRYTLSPKAIPSNVDFATYFLEESREGYCVHYATTAAILLRSMGIPVRYAEGFVLSSSDYDAERDEQGYISITDDRAHAWIEVYDPILLEWIPVEMTPGFSAEIGQVDEATVPEPASSVPVSSETPSSSVPEASSSEPVSSSSRPQTSSDLTSSAVQQNNGGSQTDTNNTGIWMPYVYSLLAVSAAFLVLLSLRRMSVVRRQHKLMKADVNASVIYGCRYLISMLRAAGCRKAVINDTPASYTKAALSVLSWLPRRHLCSVLESGQKARFAESPCSEEERAELIRLLTELSWQIPNQQIGIRKAIFRLRFPRFPR